ncbi:MAG: enoyl-CoA hydratase/isomerase family protein, partial [Actinomycetota bacterium]|nr:enoyl-CoA hydratase/isomerase family protein [Actinomycetota bacterium]
MGNETVLYEQSGNIVTITYNRPDNQNAINGQMRKELNDAWDKFSDDETAWVAILTGSGTTFCGGADLRDSSGSTGDFKGTFWEKPTINSFESGKEIYKPVIAAVNGACVGYGLTAVTFCDFVIASDNATFSYPEVTIGIPTIVGAIRLPKKLNWSDAMEFLLL